MDALSPNPFHPAITIVSGCLPRTASTSSTLLGSLDGQLSGAENLKVIAASRFETHYT